MAISDVIYEVQTSLKEIKRKQHFKKGRMEQAAAVELQVTLGQCRGKLEICKKDLDHAINAQAKNIQTGMETGAETIIQEQILWDAAIGYMLVRDAIYALETISTYDAVSHAYEMLDAAMKQVAGKKKGFPSRMKIGSTKERNAYGYLTSAGALRAKEEVLEGFFADLKVHGNIEARLAEARTPADRNAQMRYNYSKSDDASDLEERMKRLHSSEAGTQEDQNMKLSDSARTSVHPPKNAQ